MPLLTQTLAALAEGADVTMATCVHLDFRDNPMRLWDGFGDLDVGGQRWTGTGKLVSISSIFAGRDDAAGQVTFKLSGVTPEIIQTALSERSVVRRRLCVIYGQFFDKNTLQPLDALWPIARLRMWDIGIELTGQDSRSVTLSAETIWDDRNGAPFAYWSDRDQKARYPDDRAYEFIARYTLGYTVFWPVYT